MTTKQYHLSCHCQKHVLRLTLPLEGLFSNNGVCDCSHCLKRRIVWGAAPSGSLEIIRGLGKDGADELVQYRFGTKRFLYEFCGTCGTHVPGSAGEGEGETMYDMRAIRAADFDLFTLPRTLYSGIDREPAYVHPKLSDLPGAEEYLAARAKTFTGPTEIYLGSCHCQAIKYAVISLPLSEIELVDCNCSICQGNALLWAHPGRQNIFFSPAISPENPCAPDSSLLTQYNFEGCMEGKNAHFFCKTCGCGVYEYKPKKEDDAGLNGKFGLNVAMLSDIGQYLADFHGVEDDAKGGKQLKGLIKEDDKGWEPLYNLRL